MMNLRDYTYKHWTACKRSFGTKKSEKSQCKSSIFPSRFSCLISIIFLRGFMRWLPYTGNRYHSSSVQNGCTVRYGVSLQWQQSDKTDHQIRNFATTISGLEFRENLTKRGDVRKRRLRVEVKLQVKLQVTCHSRKQLWLTSISLGYIPCSPPVHSADVVLLIATRIILRTFSSCTEGTVFDREVVKSNG